MARRGTKQPLPEDFEEHILDTDIKDEMESSFLEYAYSVIYSRALPDARDGLKPVQRRILYTMDLMSLRPDRGHVKSARVVGEAMGRLHPHGDGAIYDALVRLAQPWSMRLPTVDGHGNFGSPGRPPGRDALHGVPDGRAGGRDDGLPRRGHRRLQAQLRQPRARADGPAGRDPPPHRQRHDGHRRRDGHQHGPAQPRRGRPGAAAPDREARGDPRRPDAVHPRPRPAHRRQDRRARRRPRRLRDRPRQLPDARQRARGDARPSQGHRRHRAPLRRRHGEGRRAHQDPRPGQEAAGHQRHQGPHRPREGPAPGHRGQERLPPRGAAGAALQADAAGGLLRHQRRRAGGRAAPHARSQGAARGLPRPPLRRRTPPLGATAAARPPTGCTSSTASSSPSSTSTRSSS